MIFQLNKSINQPIVLPKKYGVHLFLKREDNMHPFISGNKYRKLKYNLEEAFNQKHHTLITFGGAYSNHIAAVAAAGFEHGFKTIGASIFAFRSSPAACMVAYSGKGCFDRLTTLIIRGADILSEFFDITKFQLIKYKNKKCYKQVIQYYF